MSYYSESIALRQPISSQEKDREDVCRGQRKVNYIVVYLSLKPHDNEQIPTTTTSPRLPPKGGSLARVRGRDGVGGTLPLSA